MKELSKYDEVMAPFGNCKICGFPIGTDKLTHKKVHCDVHDSTSILFRTHKDHEATV